MARFSSPGVDDLVGISAAARRLGVTEASMRKYADTGLLPVWRTPGGQRRFRLAHLDELMRTQQCVPAPVARPKSKPRRRAGAA